MDQDPQSTYLMKYLPHFANFVFEARQVFNQRSTKINYYLKGNFKAALAPLHWGGHNIASSTAYKYVACKSCLWPFLDLHQETPNFTVSRIENAPSERIQSHCSTCIKGIIATCWGQQCFLVCALRVKILTRKPRHNSAAKLIFLSKIVTDI